MIMRYSNNRLILLLTILLIGSFIISCSRERGTRIVIKGSTTVLPITQKTAEEYRKKNMISISIEGSGSGNGIKALIDGTCDIANSSREMKKKEREQASEKGILVREIVVAYDMIIPIVHPTNSIVNLSMNQLKAIYDGSITNWKDIRGKNEKIVAISRDTSSGTFEVWHKMVMKKTDLSKKTLLQASNGAIVAVVSKNPKAIGYIGYGYLNNSVKPITVNGVQGTIENGKSGKFPISRKLYMYVNEKNLSKETKNFIDYVTSSDGQKLVKEAGFIPI